MAVREDQFGGNAGDIEEIDGFQRTLNLRSSRTYGVDRVAIHATINNPD
jgi:hypothetical protein